MERDVIAFWNGTILKISIHALRMERDPSTRTIPTFYTNFNPRAPHGARPDKLEPVNIVWVFQSTRSAWSATAVALLTGGVWQHFNPRAPHGARRSQYCLDTDQDHFNPRAPHGARLFRHRADGGQRRFQSTRSAWSATGWMAVADALRMISIHALRMERDLRGVALVDGQRISIHALRMERDFCAGWQMTTHTISIHALRMERDLPVHLRPAVGAISIHALRMERDTD